MQTVTTPTQTADEALRRKLLAAITDSYRRGNLTRFAYNFADDLLSDDPRHRHAAIDVCYEWIVEGKHEWIAKGER